MNELDRCMLLIKSIDNQAHIEFSEYTKKWYISARITIGNGSLLGGITEHRGTPETAVFAYFRRITGIRDDEFLSVGYDDERRFYEWNGAAFKELSLELVRIKCGANA